MERSVLLQGMQPEGPRAASHLNLRSGIWKRGEPALRNLKPIESMRAYPREGASAPIYSVFRILIFLKYDFVE
jgi:hypothetical protein